MRIRLWARIIIIIIITHRLRNLGWWCHSGQWEMCGEGRERRAWRLYCLQEPHTRLMGKKGREVVIIMLRQEHVYIIIILFVASRVSLYIEYGSHVVNVLSIISIVL